jgi:hypothetical protein
VMKAAILVSVFVIACDPRSHHEIALDNYRTHFEACRKTCTELGAKSFSFDWKNYCRCTDTLP